MLNRFLSFTDAGMWEVISYDFCIIMTHSYLGSAARPEAVWPLGVTAAPETPSLRSEGPPPAV